MSRIVKVTDEFGTTHVAEEPQEDTIRVLRIIEFSGPRSAVEKQVEQSIHGQKTIRQPNGQDLVIRAATIGMYPEILAAACVIQRLTETQELDLAVCGHPRRKGGSGAKYYCTEPGCKNYVPF